MTRAVAGRPDVVNVFGAVFFLIARGVRRETKVIAFTALPKTRVPRIEQLVRTFVVGTEYTDSATV